MADIKFGRKQIGKPIPANLVFWCRVYSAVGAFLLIALKTAPFITAEVEGIFDWIIGTTVGIVNVGLPLFGVDIPTATVPKENVAAIETE